MPPVLSFINAVNHQDLATLALHLAGDHTLSVSGAPLVVGRAANVTAWRAYFRNWSDYLIHVEQIKADSSGVKVVGHTTGSHRNLPDEEEKRIRVVWLARTDDHGQLARWEVRELPQ